MSEVHRCPKCDVLFRYDPEHHRCPGEWETVCAEAGVAPLSNPYDGMSWVEEQMAKQSGQ